MKNTPFSRLDKIGCINCGISSFSMILIIPRNTDSNCIILVIWVITEFYLIVWIQLLINTQNRSNRIINLIFSNQNINKSLLLPLRETNVVKGQKQFMFIYYITNWEFKKPSKSLLYGEKTDCCSSSPMDIHMAQKGIESFGWIIMGWRDIDFH